MAQCIKQPYNVGVFCEQPTGCEKCGWNPEEAKRRREQTLEKIAQKEKENER